jgi:hypothetical protein
MKRFIGVAVATACLAVPAIGSANMSTPVCVGYNTISTDVTGYSDGSARTISTLVGDQIIRTQRVDFGNTKPVKLVTRTISFPVTVPATYTIVDTPYGVRTAVSIP